MSDVAEQAGVTRQAVYKLFLGRRELVEAAIGERVAEIADALAAKNWDEDDLIESFTSVSVAVIENLRDDRELAVLLGEGTPTTLHDALWTNPVVHRGLSFWAPWLRRARQRGLVRNDLSDHELSDWLQTVYTSMVLRRDLSVADERALIQRFVLASLGMGEGTAQHPA